MLVVIHALTRKFCITVYRVISVLFNFRERVQNDVFHNSNFLKVIIIPYTLLYMYACLTI